jgi:hypothetical protein
MLPFVKHLIYTLLRHSPEKLAGGQWLPPAPEDQHADSVEQLGGYHAALSESPLKGPTISGETHPP